MALDLVSVWQLAQDAQRARYTSHCHGVDHWVRVERNGLWLAEQVEGVDELVLRLFAALHDCQREHDGGDAEHGPRAVSLIGGLDLPITRAQQAVLVEAVRTHTFGLTTSDDLTIQVCHDADRLDLGRVGTRPHPRYLSTEPARALAARDACEELDRLDLDLTAPAWLRPTPRWDRR